jgi:hypothetical protein
VSPQQLFAVAIRSMGVWQLVAILEASSSLASLATAMVSMSAFPLPMPDGVTQPWHRLWWSALIIGTGLALRVCLGCFLFFKADRIVALAYPAGKPYTEPHVGGGEVHFPQ